MKNYPDFDQFRWRSGVPKPKAHRIGDKIDDPFLGLVEVTGFQDGWPLTTYRGQPMLVLEGDLVRVVVEESATTIIHYWKTTRWVVTNWKKALVGDGNSGEIVARLALLRNNPFFKLKYGLRE
jgi:hypothetical protein